MQGSLHYWISADLPLPSWEAQIHAEHPGKAEGEQQHTQQRQHEGCSHLAPRTQQRAPVHSLPPLVVMPLDGEEHARAEDENLERNKDYRDPIDHFENFQPMT